MIFSVSYLVATRWVIVGCGGDVQTKMDTVDLITLLPTWELIGLPMLYLLELSLTEDTFIILDCAVIIHA